jgi:hypothetical protein
VLPDLPHPSPARRDTRRPIPHLTHQEESLGNGFLRPETKGIEKAFMASFWGIAGINTLELVLHFFANTEKGHDYAKPCYAIYASKISDGVFSQPRITGGRSLHILCIVETLYSKSGSCSPMVYWINDDVSSNMLRKPLHLSRDRVTLLSSQKLKQEIQRRSSPANNLTSPIPLPPHP